MDCNAKSCATCTHTCWLVHGRKSSSPVVASFFKVMLGDDFSEVLFLPPKFASEMSGFVGESASLEDANGKQWEVTVSNVNGFLAFHQGWSNFALSHDLELGDFIVFFQLTQSLFVVKIYDRTACERVSFGRKCFKRRKIKDDNSSTGKDGPPRTYTASCSDFEVCCMLNRNLGEQQEEDRICNFDLSLFETWSYSGREGSNKADVTSVISPHQEVQSIARGALHSQKDSWITPSSWHRLPMPVTAKGNNQSKLLLYQKQCSNNDTCQWAQKKFGGVSDGSIVHTSIGVKNCQSVKRMNVVKEEPMEIISDPCSQEAIQKLPGKVMKVTKEDPVGIKSKPCSQKTIQNVCENAGRSSKLTEGEYFRTISMSVRQDGRASQVAKADMVGQVVTSDGVAYVVTSDGVAHVVKTDEVAQVAKTDTVVQVVKTQVAKTEGVAPVVKADSVVQMVKAEPVNLVGTENGQSAKVMKVVKKEPVENKSAPCSQEIMGKLCGGSSGVTKDALLGCTVPQVAVKTESIDFDGSFPTFSPSTRVSLVAVKTEVVDLDERSPTFSPLLAIGGESFIELPECLPFPVVRGRADVERKTVYIRDSAKRLWPVNYHEKPGLTVLASGWAGLSKANRIKSGDQCCFTLEVESDGIYALTVVPK